MFTWICPQCGREVPPAYNECPDCAKRVADPAAAVAPPAAAVPPQQQYAPAPPTAQYATPQPPYVPQQPQYAPQQPQYAPQPPQYPPPPRSGGIPTWALTIVFALAIFGLVAGIYWLVGASRAGKPTAAVESPAAKPGAKTHPYQKYIEIAGVRFLEDTRKKTTQVRFILVNHSNAEISGLSGNVTLWGHTRNSEEDAEGTFTFTADLKGYETKEVTVPLNTKKKIYELPDWQNVSTDIQITSPQ